MATRPTSFPRWAETAGGTPSSNIADPTSDKKDAGWTDSEEPPSGILNWFQNKVYQWIAYFDGNAGIADFGDGSDGAAVFDGVGAVTGCSGTGPYTATRDLFFTDATFSANVTLKMQGFRLFVSGTLDAHAANVVISCNGGAGQNGILGAAGGTRPGGSAILGVSSGGNGSAGTGGGASTAQSVITALGGAGGVGGVGTGGGAGGVSTVTAPTAAQGSFHLPTSLRTGFLFGAAGVVPVNGGSGGSGGSGSGGGTSGGGGGAAGGVLFIAARIIRFAASSLLQAIGGVGGIGDVSGGGGGGGGGGYVLLRYRDQYSGSTSPGTLVAVTGGAGGAGGGGAPAGSNGSVGSSLVQQV
jgi:hypothetical protein